jgi:hypothetical protein
MLLANPRWERRFVRFLELSGVGRMMADGMDEDGARAARMDEWVAWDELPFLLYHLLCVFSFVSFVRGARTPRFAHSAPPRA